MCRRSLITRCLQLSRAQRGSFIRAYLQLFKIDFLLRWRGIRPIVEQPVPTRYQGTSSPTAEELASAREQAHWLKLASRYHFVRARCLHRSLALHTSLRQAGLASKFKIGVVKDGNTLRAHAWVELGGQVVDDDPQLVEPFTPLLHR